MKELEQTINYKFKNTSLLKLALTHSSVRIADINARDNQRLEFLGDAVLQLAVSRYLYEHFPDKDEGWLTATRTRLVCREALVKLAKNINLGKYIIMSKNMEQMNGRQNNHNLEDALEALIAAIFLDSDMNQITDILFNLFQRVPDLKNISSSNSKGQLQEYLQNKQHELPEYRLIDSYGPPHKRSFKVAIYINKEPISEAISNSIKSAEQKAAEIALEKLLQGENNEAK